MLTSSVTGSLSLKWGIKKNEEGKEKKSRFLAVIWADLDPKQSANNHTHTHLPARDIRWTYIFCYCSVIREAIIIIP